MSVRNAGKTIREARLKAGLTQEALSDGICSVLSLSRIENCSAGVSPATFHALMSRAGVSCEAFPTFASRKDFDCFYTLKRARFYLEAWQFQDAYAQLTAVCEMNWADSRFYYQEWLLLQYKILFYNQNLDHPQLYHLLMEAIQISCPSFSSNNIIGLLLSTVELELIIALAQEYLYLGQAEICGYLCMQIESYLLGCHLADLEKERLLAQNGIVHAKYLLAVSDHEKALSVADKNRHQMVLNNENSLLYELTFLTSVSCYHTGDRSRFLSLFQTAFYSSHAIGSCYATICLHYVRDTLNVNPPEHLLTLAEISYGDFTLKKIEDASQLHDGIFDANSNTIFYFGDLIRDLRTEQKLPQQIVCQGLCSKSKLSKIENNYLQPDIALAEALLQRLGLSERVFTFWGTEKEQKLHELKFKIMHCQRSPEKSRQEYLLDLKKLISPKQHLETQLYLYEAALCEMNYNKRLDLLFNALHITLPEFTFSHINDYKYSWLEFTILNSICWAYSNSITSHKGLRYYYFIIEYMKTASSDVILQSCIFPISLSFFIDSLYSHKRYAELLDFKPYFELPFMQKPIHFLGICFFYYSQALGECKQKNLLAPYAYYSCAINELVEMSANSAALKNYIYDDFGIII